MQSFARVGWCGDAHVAFDCRHTLGGFYLARYEDSPVGAFEEVRWSGAEVMS